MNTSFIATLKKVVIAIVAFAAFVAVVGYAANYKSPEEVTFFAAWDKAVDAPKTLNQYDQLATSFDEFFLLPAVRALEVGESIRVKDRHNTRFIFTKMDNGDLVATKHAVSGYVDTHIFQK
jgi:hypothetical protein